MKSIEQKIAPVSDYYIYSPSKTAQGIFLYPMLCGLFTYEPGYTLARNSFDSFLLMYIRRGTMQLDFAGKQQTVPENSFVLLDCYQPHGYSTQEGYECLWLHFDGCNARGCYHFIVSHLGNVFMMEDAFPALRKMNAILKVFAEGQTVREPLLSRYIYDILTEFMLYNPGTAKSKSHAEMTEKAIAFVNEHFSEDISVEQLAAMCGLSPYYFVRVFKKETGYTPHEYIISRRMASARYLLKYTKAPIKEICFTCGFSGESVFCNAFRKLHGMTPQNYRQQSMSSEETSSGEPG